MAVVVEHGTFGARAAAPIAKDVMTFLFDPQRALDTLAAMEQSWGGTPVQRMEAKYRSYVSKVGTAAPKVGDEEAVKAVITKANNPEPVVENAANPAATTRPEEPAVTPATPAPAAPTPSGTPQP
jgi:penicillin-binding protein 2